MPKDRAQPDAPPADPVELRATLTDPSDLGLRRLAEAVRGNRPAWLALLGDPGLAREALAAVLRSGVLEGQVPERRAEMVVEDLISALGAARHAEARPTLIRIFVAGQSAWQRAGDALLRLGDPESLAVVAGTLEGAENAKLRLALRAVFEADAARAFDRLSPRFAEPSERAGLVLYESLVALMRDLTDDGKAHWGPSRRWFERDPRWLELCERWGALPPAEERARWGSQHAQGIVEVAAWLRKRPLP